MTTAATPNGADAPSCTCPLIVGQSIASACPYCLRMAQEARIKQERHRQTQREQRQLRKFMRQLQRSANAR
ncbi:MAG: hypothetical protein AB9M60_00700 [Leptothrix sp. (in: b-proteobacteria)]